MAERPPTVLPGKSFNPPETMQCPIDGSPTVRLPDGSYVCEENAHRFVGTADGGLAPAGEATVQFVREDCVIFDRYPKPVHWDEENVGPEDQALFKSIRERLKLLSGWLRANAQIGISLKAFTSLYQANGKTVSHIWCCVYPAAAPNKSYALQAALIISAYGAEACICLGAGRSQLKGDQLAEAELALDQLQARLASVPTAVSRSFVRNLPKDVGYRNSWREFGGSRDFDRLSGWLVYAASPEGAQASISRYFGIDELERLGPRIADVVLELANAAAPLFKHCYPSQKEQEIEPDDKQEIEPDDEGAHTADTGAAEMQELPRTARFFWLVRQPIPCPSPAMAGSGEQTGLASLQT